MAEEISRKPGIDCTVWLLVAMIIQICNEREQAMHFEMKGAPRSIKEQRTLFMEKNRLKKSLMLSGIKAVLTSGQDPTQ